VKRSLKKQFKGSLPQANPPVAESKMILRKADGVSLRFLLNPFFSFNQRIPRCSASGFPNNSLPIEGEGLGWGCFVMIIFDTLPFIPSPRGRGDIRYPAAELRGSSFLYLNC
jgi:hypothetical protein